MTTTWAARRASLKGSTIAAAGQCPGAPGPPVVPWKPIIGMRNRLGHACLEIDYEHVWN